VIIKLFLEMLNFPEIIICFKMSNFKENYKGGQNVKSVGNPQGAFCLRPSPPLHNKYPNN
jgi:hypothetical protein